MQSIHFSSVSSNDKMKFALCFLILFASLNAIRTSDCIYRKNYIAYVVENHSAVKGLNPPSILLVIDRAFKLFERTIKEMWFVHNGEGIYTEPYEILIKFTSFIDEFPDKKQHTGFTVNNCTSAGVFDNEELRTISNSTIFINTDYVYRSRRKSKHNANGIIMYNVLIHEIGHVLGLPDTLAFESIMYHAIDNFESIEYTGKHRLPEIDLLDLNKMYVLHDGLLPSQQILQ